MARKAPPVVEPNQIGCVRKFSGMFDFDFDHHHGRKLLSDESHRSRSLSGPARSQVQMLTFDEQLKSINIESKQKTASVNRSNNTRENVKNTMEKSFWKKITSRNENSNKKKENTKVLDTIVVLKPTHRVVESVGDVGCRCSYLHSRHSSTSKQQIVKRAPVSFNDVRKKLKNSKKLKSIQKMKSCGENNGIGSKVLKKQEPEVFMEARRHLAERLRLMAQCAGLSEPLGSNKRGSRTLEKVLLSSPKHEAMASFRREPEETHNARSLLRTLSGSSRLNLDSDRQNIGSLGIDRSTEGSQLEFSLDVSSPKADSKSDDRFRENPSPVSVLDSFFTDNICSPTSTIESVELQIQPHRLDFEEHSSQTLSPPQNTSLCLLAVDRRFISSYVSDAYQNFKSNWEDFLVTDDRLESSCDHNSSNNKLLDDCVKEVLVTLHSRVTLINSKIQPFSLEKDVVNEVIEQVDWHNGQPAGPRTLDHLVKRDIAKCGQLIDTVSHENDIVFEVVDETLQELIMEAVLTFSLTC